MPSTCYTAKLHIKYLPDAPMAHLPGAYVNAWTFAPNEAAAKELIAAQTLAVHHARIVTFETFSAGNPMELRVDASDDSDSGETRPITEPEMIRLFSQESVVFTAFFTWKKPRWWKFWRR